MLGWMIVWVKLLGVNIDYELKFTNHVDHHCKRTSRQLSVIRKTEKYLNKSCIMKLFNAFILSNFNYSSIVWHFCPRESTSKVEKIHKSALRIVLNDYKSNYDTPLQLSNLQSLLISRFKAILYEVYKCTRESNPPFMNELFFENNPSLSHSQRVHVDPTKSVFYKIWHQQFCFSRCKIIEFVAGVIQRIGKSIWF